MTDQHGTGDDRSFGPRSGAGSIDPRGTVVGRRLEGIGRIAAFCSAKGGVGKTLVHDHRRPGPGRSWKKGGHPGSRFPGKLRAYVSRRCAPFPEGRKGPGAPGGHRRAVPHERGRVLRGPGPALRGPEVSDAILELLAVTQWGKLDLLLIDMPPGIGEEVLDLGRLIPRLEALVISTPSTASTSVVERLLAFLAEMRITVAGVIANMVQGDAGSVRDMAARFRVPFAGEVQLDPGIEKALGSPRLLEKSRAAGALLAALDTAELVHSAPRDTTWSDSECFRDYDAGLFRRRVARLHLQVAEDARRRGQEPVLPDHRARGLRRGDPAQAHLPLRPRHLPVPAERRDGEHGHRAVPAQPAVPRAKEPGVPWGGTPMRTLIAYRTKYGTAAGCARMLAEKIGGDTALADLADARDVNVREYDVVLVGGSIYGGKSRGKS